MQERRSERERIARELHDTLLQGVQALSFRMKRWAIDPAIPESQQREIQRVVSQTDSLIIAGREKILELRQMSARPRELLEALSEMGATSGYEGSPVLKVATAGDPRPLNARTSEEVYHIAAEAIRNACQHSGATVVMVNLDYHRRAFALSISDDGCGMTVPAPIAHYGLIGMQERAELIGGTLSIRSEPSRGTTVSLLVSRDSVYE
jgi:signal transduction histidine kinase